MECATFSFLPCTLVVDVVEMDHQHADLFACLERVKARCIECNTACLDELESLYRWLGAHCRSEERLARQIGFDFSHHAGSHGEMLRGIRRMLDEVGGGKRDVFSLLRYIDYWFECHIEQEDKPLAEAVKAQRGLAGNLLVDSQ